MKYDNKQCNKFVADMEDDFPIEHYRGRNFWQGPAVRTTEEYDLSDILARTTVKCQWDQMGKSGHIVYPVQSGELVNG